MTAPLPLKVANLPRLAGRATVPTYDRTALTPAVVHLSVGSFHRSHQAVYFDDLAQRGISRDWGVVGVGLRRGEMQDALTAQDGLYTVLERSAAGDRARVVGAIRRYLFAPQMGFAVVDALADPRTRVVTLTVTGNGYRPTAAEIAADVAHPDAPVSAMGYLVAGLARRRAAGLAPFTVLCCDNVPGNGPMARHAVASHAERRDPSLAAWIEEHGAFPSSMVDRITPRTEDEHRALLESEFGIVDRWPVVTEPFSQWVVEDRFCDGRPPLDHVGVQIVDDVAPWALAKTRLLNGSHCALGHLGELAGLETIDAAMADPALRAYVESLMEREVAPLLPDVPGLDLDAYRATLLERFANPAVADRLARLRRNGSAKMPVHVARSIAESRERGLPHPLLTLAVAAWLQSLRGVDEAGRALELDDPQADRLRALAATRGGVRMLLADPALFGDLAGDVTFADEVETALDALALDGVRASIAAALAEPDRVVA